MKSRDIKKTKTQNGILFFLCIGIIFLCAVGVYSDHKFVKAIDHFIYDQFLSFSASGQGSDKVVIVDIDEISLSAVGQWPWPRYRLARLIEKISDQAPKTIGMDIILPEPDRTSLKNISKQFQKDFGLNLKFSGAPPSLIDNDRYLAHIIQKSNLIGARYFYFDYVNKDNAAPCNYKPIAITDRTGLLSLHKATGILCNTFEIEKALNAFGFTNNQYDRDGLLRQVPLLIQYQDRIFIHFALATLFKAHGIIKAEVQKNNFGLCLQAGDFKIPINPDGFVNLRFNGPSHLHKYISAVDILNDTYSPADIKNKIVLIGSSAVGLADIHQTLFDQHFPGVEAHAVFLSGVYQKNHILIPIWSTHLVFSACVLTGAVMMSMLLYSSRPRVLVLGSLFWGCFLFLSSLFAFITISLYVSPGLPVLLTVFAFSLISFGRFSAARQTSYMWFKKLVKSQQLTMEALVSLVETRDPETGEHINRTQHYARALAQKLKEENYFSDIITDKFIEMLFLSVPLHDIGKVGVPDRILLKPGKLTKEEFDLMKLHASYGKLALERVSNKLEDDNYLKMGAQIAGSHHERWDGKGYPEGLVKDATPLSARIMSVCDVYDALISRRCYKAPISHEKSMKIILEGRGSQFDPLMVDTFFAIEDTIKEISSMFEDKIEKAPQHLIDIFMGGKDL